METELDAFLYEQLHDDTTTESTNSDMISSWLNLHDGEVYNHPSLPSQLQELENHLLYYETNEDSFPSASESLLFQEFDNFTTTFENYQSIPIGNSMIQEHIPNEYGGFFNNPEFCFPTPNEGQDGIVDHSHALTNTSSCNPDTLQPVIIEDNNCMEDDRVVRRRLDDDENDDQTEEEDPKPNVGLNSKNLVSERNRRKRLSQQLLALRALVPNITKMDKRSVLVDALSYLRNIQEETARLQKELKVQPPLPQQARLISNLRESCQDNPAGTLRIPRKLASKSTPKSSTQITEVETEKIEDRRFIVKITCKGGNGVGGDILRVLESIGMEITYASLQQIKPHEVLSTIFVRVRKQGRMTEEKLRDNITSMALKFGLTLQNP